MKFKLHDTRESRVWQQAHAEGADEKVRAFIEALRASGMIDEEIANRLKIPVREVQRLANNKTH